MSIARPTTLIFTLAPLVLSCSGMTPQDREPTTAWNQQAVTQLAAHLVTSTEALYNALREAPRSLTPGMENASGSMAGSARQLHEEAGELHANLEAGKSRSDTLNNYRRIKELSRDVGESSGFTDGAASVGGANSGMSSILSQLDTYYGAQ
jgi:hypothetical protein